MKKGVELDYRKCIDVGLRVLGMVLLYRFFSESLRLANLLIGYREQLIHAVEGTLLHAVLNMMAGSYLLFFPKNAVDLITKDARVSETIDFENDRSYRNILEIGIKLFGVYLFYVFMDYSVTAFNVAMGNYTPGDVETSGFIVQAAFHLLISLLLMFRTEQIFCVLLKKGNH